MLPCYCSVLLVSVKVHSPELSSGVREGAREGAREGVMEVVMEEEAKEEAMGCA